MVVEDLRLSLRLLRAFMAAVEHGSITGAAKALNVAPSAVAAAIDRVEAEFGATLVIRARARGVTATPAGRALAGRIRPLIEGYSDLMSEGYALGSGLSGTLRIGYYAPVAPAFLPRILQAMAAPDLTFILTECDNTGAQAGLLDGQLDVSLFAGDDLMAGVETRALMDIPPYVLMPAEHRLAGMARVDIADLAAEPVILLDLPVAGAYQRGLFRAAGIGVDIAATATSAEMVRSLVGAGLGIAVLNMRPLTALSYAGDRLCARPLDGAAQALHLVSGRAAGPPRRLVQVFLDRLHGWFDSDAAQALVLR